MQSCLNTTFTETTRPTPLKNEKRLKNKIKKIHEILRDFVQPGRITQHPLCKIQNPTQIRKKRQNSKKKLVPCYHEQS